MLPAKKISKCMFSTIYLRFSKFQVRNASSNEDLERKQKELMMKGLPKKKAIPGVKQILLVASGKGGVGKTTTAVNLAVALKCLNPSKEVGLLDADIFGPSVPLMMNLQSESPFLTDDDLMKPLTNYGVKCLSMGNLITERSAAMWRGLMVMQALDKLIRKVAWSPLDYLVVDTPPGTGDTHLSLVQNLPIAGVLLVTTPQTAALQVTKRGFTMFEKLGVPVAGIVENMSLLTCPKCKESSQIFGNKVAEFAKNNGLKVLAQVPLDSFITSTCDEGTPITVRDADSVVASVYKNLAAQIEQFLKLQEEKTAME